MIKMSSQFVLAVLILAGLFGCTQKSAEDRAMDDMIQKSIEEFKHRRIYRTLDPKTLATIADADLEQAIVDYVIAKLDSHHDQEEAVLNRLPKGVRLLWLTWVVEGQVNNGGFNQYYWNTNDVNSEDAVEAFEFFSAKEHAALMKEANRVRANEIDAMQGFKDQGSLEAFSESYKESKLNPIDSRFYRLNEDLSALRISKIRATPELFSGD
jgi:hypothetical protein